jgi:hypothetical protein
MKTNAPQRASIRSPWPTAAHPLNLLSDRRIETYILRGFYGRERQADAQAAEAERRESKRRRVLRQGDRAAVAVARLDLNGLY